MVLETNKQGNLMVSDYHHPRIPVIQEIKVGPPFTDSERGSNSTHSEKCYEKKNTPIELIHITFSIRICSLVFLHCFYMLYHETPKPPKGWLDRNGLRH